MPKTVNSLTGPAKDAYLRQLLATEPELGSAGRDRLAEKLQSEVTRVWVRSSSPAVVGHGAVLPEAGAAGETATPLGFDPFTPNVIVVLRTGGRDKVLAALGQIDAVDHLRSLAREQQLGIDPELALPDEIRSAIVTAAERRIANRRAAAS